MNKRTIGKILILATLLAIALLIAGTAVAGRPIQRASGGGQTYFEGFDFMETYAFTAMVDEAGDVSGKGQFTFVGPITFHADINCLAVDGDMAWIGMVVTHTSDESNMPTGSDWTWQIQDRGEGGNDPADLQTYFFCTDCLVEIAESCLDQPDLIWVMDEFFGEDPFELEHGNFQVK